MIAVCKHELRGYFHSLTAYVFGAFLLAVVGVGAMLYNLQAAVSNFEYVLSFSSLVFVVIVPILTMRVLAEERRQKTDQLLYSLPITTTQVVLGKYLALLAVYLIPLAVICVYPLIFAQFGEVYLPTSYGSLFAFFLLGAALLAALAIVLSVPVYLALYITYYLTLGMYACVDSVLVQSETPDEVRGTVMSAQSLLQMVGAWLGTGAAGLWLGHGSIPGLWLLCAAVLAGGTAACLVPVWLLRRAKRRAKPLQNV